jgi:hypothetical protein
MKCKLQFLCLVIPPRIDGWMKVSGLVNFNKTREQKLQMQERKENQEEKDKRVRREGKMRKVNENRNSYPDKAKNCKRLILESTHRI